MSGDTDLRRDKNFGAKKRRNNEYLAVKRAKVNSDDGHGWDRKKDKRKVIGTGQNLSCSWMVISGGCASFQIGETFHILPACSTNDTDIS